MAEPEPPDHDDDWELVGNLDEPDDPKDEDDPDQEDYVNGWPPK